MDSSPAGNGASSVGEHTSGAGHGIRFNKENLQITHWLFTSYSVNSSKP